MLTFEKIYDKNVVLNSIENGFKKEIQNIRKELKSINIQELIEDVWIVVLIQNMNIILYILNCG